MRQLEFDAWFGDKQKKVCILEPSGGGGYQIFIDRYLVGTIIRHKNDLKGFWNSSRPLSGDDLLVLLEMVEDWERTFK
jgi:hypothetical protein